MVRLFLLKISQVFGEDQLVIDESAKDNTGESSSFDHVDHYISGLKLIIGIVANGYRDEDAYYPYYACFGDVEERSGEGVK